jgi:hypothetical protein
VLVSVEELRSTVNCKILLEGSFVVRDFDVTRLFFTCSYRSFGITSGGHLGQVDEAIDSMGRSFAGGEVIIDFQELSFICELCMFFGRKI